MSMTRPEGRKAEVPGETPTMSGTNTSVTKCIYHTGFPVMENSPFLTGMEKMKGVHS